MESLTVFVFVGIWILLGTLADRFGVDTRDGTKIRPPRRLWDLPQNRPTPQQLRGDDHQLEPPRTSFGAAANFRQAR
jgi:hypothetical protein